MLMLFSDSELICWCFSKLDGVGPIDNRPSSDKLHLFLQKRRRKKEEEKITFDI